MDDEKIKRTVLKITFLGDTTVGKTSICNRILNLEFRETTLATMGRDKSDCKMKMRDGKEMKIILWDTAGQERFFSIAMSTVRNSQGVILVFDVGNKKTFENINMWLEKIRAITSNLPIVLFGNKCDIGNREVTKEEAQKLANSKKMIYFETSAKNNTGINEGFEELINEAYDMFKFQKGKDLSEVNDDKKKGCCLTSKSKNNKKKGKK